MHRAASSWRLEVQPRKTRFYSEKSLLPNNCAILEMQQRSRLKYDNVTTSRHCKTSNHELHHLHLEITSLGYLKNDQPIINQYVIPYPNPSRAELSCGCHLLGCNQKFTNIALRAEASFLYSMYRRYLRISKALGCTCVFGCESMIELGMEIRVWCRATFSCPRIH